MPNGTETPRRQARGERRRQEIAAAALRIVEREGLDGVTHRTVAAEAGVPLAATTYYFAGLEELMEAAMELLIEREARTFEELGRQVLEQDLDVAQGIEGVIAFQAWLLHEQRLVQISQFELFLRVARGPGARSSWIEPYLEVGREIFARLGAEDPELAAQGMVALINGLALHQLTAPQEDFDERVLGPVLRHFMASTLPA